MGIEQPKAYSHEEMVKMHKSRALSDAELLKESAEYEISDDGRAELRVTDKQREDAFDNMKVALLKEKDPKRFEDTYNRFVEVTKKFTVHNGYVPDGRHTNIDENGQVIASEKNKEEVRDEMYRDFLKRNKDSREYIEAVTYFRHKEKYETEKMPSSDGKAVEIATDQQVNKAREEMYLERMNTMPDSEYLLTLSFLIKPGTLESLKNITAGGGRYCCSIAYGREKELCAHMIISGEVDENENFIGQACDADYSSLSGAVALFVCGGKKTVFFEYKQIRDHLEYGDLHPISGDSFSEKNKNVFNALRNILKKEFFSLAEKQGFSKEQAEMMLKAASE